MFGRPTKTLQQSLFHVLENAQEYIADIYFDYPTKIWAHKAILLARVPPAFREKYMPQLLTSNSLDIASTIPYPTFKRLLRFWYTADFDAPLDLSSSSPSGLQTQVVDITIRQEIKQLEAQLGCCLLPEGEDMSDKEQWIADLKRMIDDKLCTDVVLNIFEANQQQQQRSSEQTQVFPAHRFILASQSTYFHSVFCTEFREASTSSVHLPSDLFSPDALQVILYYLYTDKLILPRLDSSNAQKKHWGLNEKRYELRILQKVFVAADYLGHANTICKAVLVRMQTICHQFNCVCQECAALLPFMLFFADREEKKGLTKLKEAIIRLYSDPLESLAPLWSQRPFATLVQRSSATYIQTIAERTLSNISQHNAVRVLHSLHLCLSALRSADPVPTWSQPTLKLLQPLLNQTTDMVANHFEYYCVEYPILLSCVDGIGQGFSVDFLEFVLTRVLNEGINDTNAAPLYQGIVRDLGGRQEIVKNVAVDGVLSEARSKCAQYIGKRWMMIKAENGFQSVEKEILKELSEDINIPYRQLTKPLENDFSTIFSFKPKKPQATAKAEPPSLKRLSIQEVEENKPRESRARSLSSTTTTTISILKKHTESDVPEDNTPFQKARRQEETSLTEALLPIDVKQDNIAKPPRQSRLRFALPDTPSRPHRPTMQQQQKKRAKSPKSRSRWSLNMSDSSDEEGPASIVPEIGQKVELLRRPLPTLGTIKYIGSVEFSKGTWVGVELESRVGNNDGSVNGKRYFQTFPQRGVFVKLDDFKIISTPEKK
ncbi:hypothetical protein G6F57_001655 [Rhizopus arrhizus]|uniref:CAP-Gly domain-containing protein n=1 Tax=Rhizopus oryzae TaxID=64495 RepID=A0A9P6XI13_RHIOR|nr:hypothetical protein G6F23_008265 [Rhizopus arrhizus]KAG1425459.1 hypothetical protein G6F58_001908 [Rhizopus delemar]KAG0769442.1 hypothetical protein G6F24_001081 [Rhizopus arrhizus]KAG0796358.1 hypothetical protein G6F21_001385 [Rhizopus arrhizus]KAG0817801.1 hypothetical protein G6F20_002099 [Rhizopus arrhizus]